MGEEYGIMSSWEEEVGGREFAMLPGWYHEDDLDYVQQKADNMRNDVLEARVISKSSFRLAYNDMKASLWEANKPRLTLEEIKSRREEIEARTNEVCDELDKIEKMLKCGAWELTDKIRRDRSGLERQLNNLRNLDNDLHALGYEAIMDEVVPA